MKVAIYGKTLQKEFVDDFLKLTDLLTYLDMSFVVYNTLNEVLKEHQISVDAPTFSEETLIENNIDVLLSIGGDGTLLSTTTLLKDSGIPVLGLNTGRLGFLSNTTFEDISYALQCLKEGNYSITERLLLSVKTDDELFGEFNYAMNEVSIFKKDSSSMIIIHAYLNGEFLNSYWADGLIIATPTGSTAYSLSCGGPIVIPGSDNFIITPIAPHNLNVRPLVIATDNEITLKVEGRDEYFLTTVDGRNASIKNGSELTITKAAHCMHVIQLPNNNFFKTLRNKLSWGLDKRN